MRITPSVALAILIVDFVGVVRGFCSPIEGQRFHKASLPLHQRTLQDLARKTLE